MSDVQDDAAGFIEEEDAERTPSVDTDEQLASPAPSMARHESSEVPLCAELWNGGGLTSDRVLGITTGACGRPA